MPQPRLTDWLMLATLVVFWGSSFMLIKVALGALSPAMLVAARLTLAAIVLVILLLPARKRLPPPGRVWLFLLAIAVFGNCLPFYLISWGEQEIDSNLAGILMAIMPLATLTLAHFIVPGERMNKAKLAGFVLGFCGIAVLLGPQTLLKLEGSGAALIYQLAVLGGALCYALSAVIARLKPPSDTVGSSAGVVIIGALIMLLVVSLGVGGSPVDTEWSPQEIIAVLLLGIFSTALAQIVFFKLIESAGPSFMSLINYLIPLWAVVIGYTLLGEQLRWNHAAALGLILAGIALSRLPVEYQHKQSINDS